MLPPGRGNDPSLTSEREDSQELFDCFSEHPVRSETNFCFMTAQVLPLGTGNDLSLTFGWGNTFLPAWLRDFASVYHLLRRIADAQPRELDCWRISITSGAAMSWQLHLLP